MVKLVIVLAVLVLPGVELRERTQRDRFPPRPVVDHSTLPPVGTEVSDTTPYEVTEQEPTQRVVTTERIIEKTSVITIVERTTTVSTECVTQGFTTEGYSTSGKVRKATVITSTLMLTSPESTTERAPGPKIYKTGLSVGSIVGVVVGTLLFFVALATVSCYCYCSRRRGAYRFRAGLPGVGQFDGGFTPAVALKVSDYFADDDEIITSFRHVPDADRWGGRHVEVSADVRCEIEMDSQSE